jgi:DNA-binding NarL/FixJ family response regulator
VVLHFGASANAGNGQVRLRATNTIAVARDDADEGGIDEFPPLCTFDEDIWIQIANVLALSARQTEITRLICAGYCYKSIAVRVGISVNTVRMHVRALFAKLRVRDRLGVVLRVFALERAFLEPRRLPGRAARGIGAGR